MAWRLLLTVLVGISFMLGALNIPGMVVSTLQSARDLFGGLASVASAVAWALSTTFDKTAMAAGSNIMAAVLAAMSTGFFTPVNQLV
jgi:hypothetical protein